MNWIDLWYAYLSYEWVRFKVIRQRNRVLASARKLGLL